METLSGNFSKDATIIEDSIGYARAYDVIKREIEIGGKRAFFYYVFCITNDLLAQQLIEAYLNAKSAESPQSLTSHIANIASVRVSNDVKFIAESIFSGDSVLLIEGFGDVIISDTKNIPSRSLTEPENDHVLRGPREGFLENLKENTALLRKRLKTKELVMKRFSVGDFAPSAIQLCYIRGRANEKLISDLEKKIGEISVDALSMGQESLAECLTGSKWYNPFPRFRFTERPDAACAMLLEGSIIILCDNSPMAMILPSSLVDFLQECDDFYFPPSIGSYFRLLRLSIFFTSLFLAPLWYLCVRNPDIVPKYLEFILPSKQGLPILAQLIFIELILDAIKLASVNTPSMMNGSIGIVAGLIIGDFSVNVGWLSPEVVLYMAVVAISNFTQPSFELGYAFKFCRTVTIILIHFFDSIGFICGITVVILLIARNHTVTRKTSYLYPMKPFSWRALKRQIIREKLEQNNKKN
ncbi:MAG: spore germination protein [Clostridia bacterium]|nr:spore germination protein [Clostridia bacterium]MBQ9749414.1 spore germination protein [Clostridia bacterium]